MSTLIGRRFGAYEVLARLGAGGMGEVYRARDAKLGRDVALKILPHVFTADADRLARFDREARVLASLNHPHIGAIYGLEEIDGLRALVLELVDGDTLADRAGGRPMDISDALTLARQMADALEAAHDRGIVHRDLKPANIKVTPAGVVKVLDFGLAKSVASEVAASGLTQSPTWSVGATSDGVLLGTAPYMSPEQARGQPVDKRTDIWAFGCVAYELVTGRRAFPGATATDTLAAIVTREPDWRALPETTPAGIRRLLRRCLEKDPKRRLHDIADARIEIDDALAGLQETAGTSASDRASRRWRAFALSAVGALVLTLAAWLVVLRKDQPSTASTVNSGQASATQLTNYDGSEGSPALSPDGRSFAFVSNHGGTPDIWLRQVSGGEAVRLTNDPAEEADLIYSPDGEAIYFTRREAVGPSVWRVGALGGAPQKILSAARQPAPSPDGRRLAYFSSEGAGDDVVVIGMDGAGKRTLVHQVLGGVLARRPVWAPDGRRIAYTHGPLFSATNLSIVDVETGTSREVTRFTRGNEGITGGYVWLPDNRHLVVSYVPVSRQLPPNDLGILDLQDGSIARLTMAVGQSFTAPSLAADGSRLIATSTRPLREVWKVPIGFDPDGKASGAVQVLDSTWDGMWSFVTRDGRTLLFNSPVSGSMNLWTMAVDRSTPPRQITAVPGSAVAHSSLSPDGTRVAFVSIATGSSELWTQNVDGSELRQLTKDGAAHAWPVWSPDGRWIVFNVIRGNLEQTWRTPSAGGDAEKIGDDFFRGDWQVRPDGHGTWLVSSDGADRGFRLFDPETREVLWEERRPGVGLALPKFSADGRRISIPIRHSRTRDAIWVYDVATRKGEIAAILPFHVTFRADWVDGDRAFIVNRSATASHIVMFDRLWSAESVR